MDMLALLWKSVMHAGDATEKAELSLAMTCSSGKEQGGRISTIVGQV